MKFETPKTGYDVEDIVADITNLIVPILNKDFIDDMILLPYLDVRKELCNVKDFIIDKTSTLDASFKIISSLNLKQLVKKSNPVLGEFIFSRDRSKKFKGHKAFSARFLNHKIAIQETDKKDIFHLTIKHDLPDNIETEKVDLTALLNEILKRCENIQYEPIV